MEENARQYVREQTGMNLSLFEYEDEIRLTNFISSISNAQIQVIGPEIIFGTLYDRIGYGRINNELFKHLVVTRLFNYKGNPIGYELFEGNIFEGNTFIPVLQRMEKRFNLGKPVVIADSGLLFQKNIIALEDDRYEYILGARPKNDTENIKQAILALELKDGDVSVINKTKTIRLIVSKTDKRASKDAYNRKRGLERLTKRLNSGKLTKANINNKGYNKYLKMEGKISISIDLEKYNADANWDGIKGYITNTILSPKQVIDNYKNLWFIERAFRMNKTDLRVRPIYHRLYNRIEAHICICFTAYSIMLELERLLMANKSTISLKRAQKITYNMYQIVYQLPNSKETKTQILKMDVQQQELYNIISMSKLNT